MPEKPEPSAEARALRDSIFEFLDDRKGFEWWRIQVQEASGDEVWTEILDGVADICDAHIASAIRARSTPTSEEEQT